VFEPLRADQQLVDYYVTQYALPGTPEIHDWARPRGEHLLGKLSVWFPPPELARQCLIGVLESWIERPWTTSALFFIPRTLARCWTGLSKHIKLLDTLQPHLTPLTHPPLLPIPVLVLYLPPHTPVPPPRWMEHAPKPQGFRWHEREAARMRSLHEGDPP
jgi:hypothetical protein